MVAQISSTYFQAYKLAYDLAKRAERCFRYELGLDYVELHPVRLLGQPAQGPARGRAARATTCKRMEAAYLQTRTAASYEITRHVSLVLARSAGVRASCARQGWCDVDLPEELFDADYPGHYLRRIKSVEPDAARAWPGRTPRSTAR